MNVDKSWNFVVADDHPLVRQGVRLVLETEFADCTVVEAADMDTALAAIVAQPDALLLIDLDMPGMDGAESLRALRSDFPSLVMAVLSGNAERQTIMAALEAGVNGYILKASPPEEMLNAIATMQGGRIYLGDVLSRPATRPGFSAPAQSTAPFPGPGTGGGSGQQSAALTPRQREVIGWLMQGHSNKQIARALDIGEGTVKIHLAAIFRVLGAKNRTDAVLIATRLGL